MDFMQICIIRNLMRKKNRKRGERLIISFSLLKLILQKEKYLLLRNEPHIKFNVLNKMFKKHIFV